MKGFMYEAYELLNENNSYELIGGYKLPNHIINNLISGCETWEQIKIIHSNDKKPVYVLRILV